MAPYMGLCLLKAVNLHQGAVTPLMGANQFPGMLLQLQVRQAAHVSGRRSMATMQGACAWHAAQKDTRAYCCSCHTGRRHVGAWAKHS